ncbi:TPA_asm: ShlB/FhaC/HecB family hemolysin secretion/activation protein, partial [Salmonella enterica subsp. enterica serovar Typhimurium]|nr:ShlB/FhaC/HecB family hemolysin secretion/activation protein [Salmonella enterica subsp. enterica serovar Typhimurium]
RSSRIPALSPLAVLVMLGTGMCSSGAMAAFLTPPTGAGQLGNQLRQEAETVPAAPVAPALSLPADDRGQVRAPASNARVTVKQVSFTGEVTVPGARGVTDAALQKVVAPWLGKPLSFTDLQAMTEAVTQYYRDRGVLLARAVLPPQTIKDGLLTVRVVPG